MNDKPKTQTQTIRTTLPAGAGGRKRVEVNVDVDHRRRRFASSHGSLRANNLLADFFGHQNVTTRMQC